MFRVIYAVKSRLFLLFNYFRDTGKKQSFTSDVTGSGAQRATKDYLLWIYTKIDLAKQLGAKAYENYMKKYILATKPKV